MVETYLSIVALVLIVGMARIGMLFGVFYELTSTLLLFLAMMITLRYWYVATRLLEGWFPGAGCYGALGAYWTLFLIGAIPLIVILNRVTTNSVPRYPKTVDAALGFVFGIVSSTILTCCVATSLSVIAPKIWETYDRSALLVPFDRLPISMYQHIERHWLAVSAEDPHHTRFPTFEKADADNFQKFWR